MSQSLLSAQNLSCERGYRQLFRQLDLSVSSGELLRIAGSNGSGKSTLLNVLTGLSSDYHGELFWCGEPLQSVRHEYQAAMCYLGHNKAVKPQLTVSEHLQWFRTIYPCRNDESRDAVLYRLGLYRYRDSLCGHLSAGQQQRVALARLLISAARLWILDEPFTAIDRQGVAEFEQVICDFVTAGGAIILTTHHTLQLSMPSRTIELGSGEGSQ